MGAGVKRTPKQYTQKVLKTLPESLSQQDQHFRARDQEYVAAQALLNGDYLGHPKIQATLNSSQATLGPQFSMFEESCGCLI